MSVSLKRTMLLYNVFAVIPFLIFLAWGAVLHSMGAAIFALLFSPIALVVVGLDVYHLWRRIKKTSRVR